MKYLTRILLTLTLLCLAVPTVLAASLEMSARLPTSELPASSEVSVPIVLKSTDPYNAYTVTLEFENLQYVDTKFDTEWTAVNGPVQTGNTYTFTAALLGKNKSKESDTTVATVKFKTPAEGTFSIKGDSVVALTDQGATQVTTKLEPSQYTVTNDKIKSTLFNIENSTSWFYLSLKIILPVIVIIGLILIFRMRKRKPGKKPMQG
jgi:hypothetical protein